jgi:hypothetical protein
MLFALITGFFVGILRLKIYFLRKILFLFIIRLQSLDLSRFELDGLAEKLIIAWAFDDDFAYTILKGGKFADC